MSLSNPLNETDPTINVHKSFENSELFMHHVESKCFRTNFQVLMGYIIYSPTINHFWGGGGSNFPACHLLPAHKTLPPLAKQGVIDLYLYVRILDHNKESLKCIRHGVRKTSR